MRHRLDVLHGVNLDQLERRDASVYGGGSLTELEVQVGHFAAELSLQTTFWQSNHEGEFCESLH
ncbi:MAG: type II 3-dehydroquinate dehydratase, partial [Gaiellaceae bacterium]